MYLVSLLSVSSWLSLKSLWLSKLLTLLLVITVFVGVPKPISALYAWENSRGGLHLTLEQHGFELCESPYMWIFLQITYTVQLTHAVETCVVVQRSAQHLGIRVCGGLIIVRWRYSTTEEVNALNSSVLQGSTLLTACPFISPMQTNLKPNLQAAAGKVKMLDMHGQALFHSCDKEH